MRSLAQKLKIQLNIDFEALEKNWKQKNPNQTTRIKILRVELKKIINKLSFVKTDDKLTVENAIEKAEYSASVAKSTLKSAREALVIDSNSLSNQSNIAKKLFELAFAIPPFL